MLANTHKEELIPRQDGLSDIELLAESVSPELAQLLVLHYPGIELRIPKRFDSSHHLAQNLGQVWAKALCDYAGGGILYISTSTAVTRELRDMQIRNLVGAGVCRRDIALKICLSQRQLRRLLNKLGLSKKTNARSKNKTPIAISRDSNGGLTGGKVPLTYQPSQTSKNLASRAVKDKYGFYKKQQKDGFDEPRKY